ncbi:MAG: pilus assembly protein TadG-related protein [Chloroflexota bacterium]
MPFLPRLRSTARRSGRSEQERGQVIVLFVIMAVALIGCVAIVTDVSWLWVNQQRMQRAADAAALAGAIYLPGDPTTAYSTARAEAAKNGYTNGTNGVVVTPMQDPHNKRRLNVTITGPVGTYFARVFCMSDDTCLARVNVGATGKAEYVLPVPMGSPQNYYGVGYFIDAVTTTTSALVSGDTGWDPTSLAVTGGTWTKPTRAYTSNSSYATATANGNQQVWNTFGLLSGTSALPNDASLQILGIEVRLNRVALTGNGTSTNCQVRTEISWDAGTTWSTANTTSPALTTTTSDTRTVGSATSLTNWGSHSWVRNDFTDSNFRVRLTWVNGNASCAATRGVQLDLLETRVSYRYNQVTTTTSFQPVNVVAPDGTVLAPQNFWGAMQSQGAPMIQGDAYMTKWNPRSTSVNPLYAPNDYYNYAIEMPPGTTNGEVWIFDPGFCDGGSSRGTGENWTVGAPNGYSSRDPISSFFDLFNTNNTPYDSGDDTLVASTNNTFRQLSYSDFELGVTTATDCATATGHHSWYRLAQGLSGGSKGTVYRLHTYSTDPSSPSQQDNATGLNAFAFWAKAAGGTPKVYGIGSMEAYIRLPGGTSSEFYMAKVEAQHAGKTLEIDLWDPGDTGNLSATLQILQPTTTSYQPVAFSYTATATASGASACSSRSGTNVTSVVTNTGGTSLFNGCWITISIPLPNTYSAPHPSSDTITSEGGWWKIRYTMGGLATDFSTDLTTWQVQVRGSPVHLVLN